MSEESAVARAAGSALKSLLVPLHPAAWSHHLILEGRVVTKREHIRRSLEDLVPDAGEVVSRVTHVSRVASAVLIEQGVQPSKERPEGRYGVSPHELCAAYVKAHASVACSKAAPEQPLAQSEDNGDEYAVWLGAIERYYKQQAQEFDGGDSFTRECAAVTYGVLMELLHALVLIGNTAQAHPDPEKAVAVLDACTLGVEQLLVPLCTVLVAGQLRGVTLPWYTMLTWKDVATLLGTSRNARLRMQGVYLLRAVFAMRMGVEWVAVGVRDGAGFGLLERVQQLKEDGSHRAAQEAAFGALCTLDQHAEDGSGACDALDIGVLGIPYKMPDMDACVAELRSYAEDMECASSLPTQDSQRVADADAESIAVWTSKVARSVSPVQAGSSLY